MVVVVWRRCIYTSFSLVTSHRDALLAARVLRMMAFVIIDCVHDSSPDSVRCGGWITTVPQDLLSLSLSLSVCVGAVARLTLTNHCAMSRACLESLTKFHDEDCCQNIANNESCVISLFRLGTFHGR